VVGRKMVPPLSRALSKGGGWRWLERRRPSVSLFEGIRWLEDPSVSCFERGRGTGVVGRIVVVGASTTHHTKRGVVGCVGQDKVSPSLSRSVLFIRGE